MIGPHAALKGSDDEDSVFLYSAIQLFAWPAGTEYSDIDVIGSVYVYRQTDSHVWAELLGQMGLDEDSGLR